jgi:uncharacterized protein (DUF433 family)
MTSRLTMNEKLEPSIRDLNIKISDLLRWLGSGQTEQQIIEDHPGLEREDFPAVYRYIRPNRSRHRDRGRQ